MIPTYFAVLVLVASFCAPGVRMITVFVVACLFGGSAAIELTALGGAPITPAVFALPFLLFYALKASGQRSFVGHATDRSAGLWLLLLILWGVLSAYFMPRLFAGYVLVNSTDRSGLSLGVLTTYLKPNSTNVTQTCYAIGGLCAFLAMRTLLSLDVGLARFRDAVLLLAALNITAAFINLAEHHLGFPSVMEYVRNARYAVMDGGEVGGLVRISGTFPETSAFSSFTAPLFVFAASVWHSGQRRRYSGWLALISLGLLAFSTSSTAYATLLVYFLLLCTAALWRAVVQRSTPRLGAPVILAWCVVVAVCCVMLLKPEWVTRSAEFFQLTMVRKLESSSGVERSSWNAQAWHNFLDTYGLGAGLGSARASSFPMVLLSNLGVIGTTLFVVFVAQVFRRAFSQAPEPMAPAKQVSRAAGHAMLVTLIAASISGTVFDIGMAFYVFSAAAAMGGLAPRPARQLQEAGPVHAL